MSSKIFKFSVVAATVAASFSASAALYNVYHNEPMLGDSETYGVAIQNSNIQCWVDNCNDEANFDHTSEFKIAYEEKVNPEGFDYRNESPFLMEYGYDYLDDGRSGFENYCDRYLGYSNTLCEKWADHQYYDGYAKEGSVNNSLAFVEGTGVQGAEDNVIINQIDGNGEALGTYYKDSLKNRSEAYVGTTVLKKGTGVQSKVFAKHNDLYVGSVSFSTSNASDFRSQAAVWNGTAAEPVLIKTEGVVSGRSIPQGSARDIADVNGTVYAVGYNASSNETPVAAVWTIDPNNVTTEAIEGKLIGVYNDEEKYLNSVLTSVNDSGIAIGTAKYKVPNGNAYSNSLFYVPNVASPSSKSFAGDIFFSSANGKAGAINNHNVVVGQIDYERHSESNGGKPRAKRAFVAPIEDSPNASIFNNRGWYLDDLTNGIAANNAYRIVDAQDINDAGVIAGTAYYCAGGFDNSDIDASCASGASKVAVKLVPVNGASASDISERPRKKESIERQGASFGLWALTLLGLIGFRRK
ncbi:DUF3466 family protein [Vibrio nereis]|uniref:DUF3466 family protein n=1 Tax=Vibrio nereis TaxID=693 RepID=UPI0024948661|nr:DUF3466 family protein [Vibrio nereis]